MAYTTINKPTEHFNTKLYTGNGSTQSITGVGFQPDFTWIKNRSGSYWHNLTDSVRGVTKVLYSAETSAETTTSNYLSSFNTDGFTVSTDSDVNGNGNSIVAWNWLGANGTASNTDGSITSSVSANTTAGFSIVTYSGNSTAGATVGHGLGATPGMIIVKGRDAVINWQVYHQAIGNTSYLELDTTDASTVSSARWNNTTPTSTVFTLGTQTGVNAGFDYVAYCFAEKKGFSKFGSYTGNGSTDGTFVYTGFKPAFVMIKRTSGTDQWILYDTKRETGNVMNLALTPDSSDAEQDTSSYNTVDIVSNGFKCRGGSSGSGTGTNQSGGSYIYMSFAEAPLVGSNGVTAKAR